jgi:hypothetical protein
MRLFLFLAGVLVLALAPVGLAQDRKARDQRNDRAIKPAPAGPPPGAKLTLPQPEPKANPFGTTAKQYSAATARRMLPQLEEEVELIEAHRDIRKAHVRAAEVAVRSAEVQFELIDKAGNVPQIERAKARLEVEAARAQLEIKMAEVKEVEIKVKYAKKRLDDAKAAAAAPPPGRPAAPIDPPPPFRNLQNRDPQPAGDPRAAAGGDRREPTVAEQARVVEAAKARVLEAQAAAANAEAQLVRVRKIAEEGRVTAAQIEAAEFDDRKAQLALTGARAALKKAEAELDSLKAKGPRK